MYKKAIKGKLFMGLNNKICQNPAYWCRLHEIYLSEKDVKQRRCKNLCSVDMIDTYRCMDLENIKK